MPEIHGAAGGLANVEGWAKIRRVWAKNGGVWAKIEKVGTECMFVAKVKFRWAKKFYSLVSRPPWWRNVSTIAYRSRLLAYGEFQEEQHCGDPSRKRGSGLAPS